MDEIIKQSPVLWVLSAVVTGFIAGIAAYIGLLKITNQETIIKGTYEPKKNLVGRVLKNEVLIECGKLIELAGRIDGATMPDKVEAYMTQTLIFLEGLDLPKVQQYHQLKMSWPAYTIQLLLVNDKLSSSQKLGRAQGVLEGLRSSFSASAGG
ncbi:MAG: hypothetical protein JNIBNLAF_01961 [Nitrosomonas europaea]|nr:MULTISPECIES: hypothetical protein [Nitrosomonas]MBV6390289.1 hypothetical protein [Nitrosomonas europaea]